MFHYWKINCTARDYIPHEIRYQNIFENLFIVISRGIPNFVSLKFSGIIALSIINNLQELQILDEIRGAGEACDQDVVNYIAGANGTCNEEVRQ